MQLNQSITDNLVWGTHSICIFPSHFEQSLDNKISPNATNLTKQLVDVANFLDDSLRNSISLSSFQLALGYPPNAVLEIEGYLGLAEENNVLNVFLKSAVAAGGMILVTNLVKTGRRLVMFKIVVMKCCSHKLCARIGLICSAIVFFTFNVTKPCTEPL
jgi:hypothetical protein